LGIKFLSGSEIAFRIYFLVGDNERVITVAAVSSPNPRECFGAKASRRRFRG
jgi:hypothetical protein